MTATTLTTRRSNAGVWLIGVLFALGVVVTVPLYMPGGEVTATVSPHVAKHEAGTLPASTIRDEIERRNYELYWSPTRTQYLAIVRMGAECGGAIVRHDLKSGKWIIVTIFGGSECTIASCDYWYGVVIPRDGYIRMPL